MTELKQVPSSPSDFDKDFDPLKYTLRYFGTPPPTNKLRAFILKFIHKFFHEVLPNRQHELSVLDYGCGPVIAYSISAAGHEKVSEIVFSEFALPNRVVMKQWFKKEEGFDWSLYFKYVVQTLEGKSENDVVRRQERMRKISKVVSCDITNYEDPIERGYEGPYDVVVTVLAIENVCKSEDEYLSLLNNLSKLVKPGGYLLLFAQFSSKAAQSIYYDVGHEKIYYFAATRELVFKALENALFCDVDSSKISMHEVVTDLSASEAAHIESFSSSEDFYYMFVQAKKTKM